jgi:hypothetical protein
MKKALLIIGKMNLMRNNLIFLVLCVFFIVFNTTAQKYPKTLVISQDTLVCFTLKQAKKLAIINEENKMLKENLTLSENEISKLNKINLSQSEIIENSKEIDTKYHELLNSYEVEKKANDRVKSMLQRRIIKQTIYKYLAIGAGVLTSGFLTYKLVTK